MQVRDKVAVVTGAAGGIGGAIARRLLEAGAHVAVTDLDGDRLAETARELGDLGRVVSLAGDASSTEHLTELLALTRRELGPVDLFFANAGVAPGSGLSDEAEWHLALEVNLMAHVRAAQLVVPDWVERGEGYFVSTASAAGLVTQIGSATYAVSKHAAVAFAEWLSVTYGEQGVHVSCLAPMGVETELMRAGERQSDPLARAATSAVTNAGDVLSPLQCADVVMAGLETEEFLILPHPDVLKFFQFKGAAYDKWLAGMRAYQRSLL